ncbi:hypothetical protein FCOIX_123 [Fusarium coicis]|nr:hypothetical protein FCOIX_123 [Fusarium coicis]
MDPPVRGTRLVPGKVSFVDLAPELQSMIMEFLMLSICPLSVPCAAKTKYYPITSAGEKSLLNLKLSCCMIYKAIKEKRFVEAFTIVQPQPPRRECHPSQGAVIFPPSRKAFSIDPNRNMLRVWGMKLPHCHRFSGNIPVRRLLSVWLDKPVHHHSTRPTRVLWNQDPLIPDLQLAKLGRLEELYIVAKKKSQMTSGFRAFASMSASDRPATLLPTALLLDSTSASGAMVPFEPPARPLVGLYGYDKTETTRGGFWAGFLYYPVKREVWFSPLSALETCDATHVPVADKPERKLFEGTHSDFVARVWIIRQDRDLPPAQPYHRWVKIQERPAWRSSLYWGYRTDVVHRSPQSPQTNSRRDPLRAPNSSILSEDREGFAGMSRC